MVQTRVHAEESIPDSDVAGSGFLVFRLPYLETSRQSASERQKAVIILTCAVHPSRDLVCPLYATMVEKKQAPGVLSNGTLCMLRFFFSFLCLITSYSADSQTNTHLGSHPITSQIYTQEQGDVLLAYLHKCPNIAFCERKCSSHTHTRTLTHTLRVPCRLHPSACSE